MLALFSSGHALLELFVGVYSTIIIKLVTKKFRNLIYISVAPSATNDIATILVNVNDMLMRDADFLKLL